ncbi:MAG TPA: PPOX class F420-dependent oxidoreductase [Candidatus Dormibacteraeota bacterium]|jgi:PPOX class probable F420-dependent enzyme|nr:PPOX class F420-dependent oxidoreductase [Candidatus Dormibacteraeota bacterium]
MATIPESARVVLDSGRLAHLATINPDGTPHVTCVWVRAEGDEVVLTSMTRKKRYVHNLERDPHLAISVHTDHFNEHGLQEYLVVYGTAAIVDGGAAQVLTELAAVYLGPDNNFSLGPNPPAGHLIRITPDRLGGVGAWMED